MRLIDADRARETATIDLIVHHLDRQPTVDAVEIVFCKDCKYHMGLKCYAKNFLRYDPYVPEIHMTANNDFCSYGKRKSSTQPQREDV